MNTPCFLPRYTAECIAFMQGYWVGQCGLPLPHTDMPGWNFLQCLADDYKARIAEDYTAATGKPATELVDVNAIPDPTHPDHTHYTPEQQEAEFWDLVDTTPDTDTMATP